MLGFFKKKEANIKSGSGCLLLVDTKGNVLKTSQSNDELRKWAAVNGYTLPLGNGIDRVPYTKDFCKR